MLKDNSGQFKVTFQPALERRVPAFAVILDSLPEAKKALDTLANYTLHLHQVGIMEDYSNFGMIEKLIVDEWINIEDLDHKGL
jgi:hypothetical protein